MQTLNFHTNSLLALVKLYGHFHIAIASRVSFTMHPIKRTEQNVPLGDGSPARDTLYTARKKIRLELMMMNYLMADKF